MTIPGKLKLVAAPTIVPVIMAGGNGSRLWPLSRELYPKQFLPLLSKHSLLQETVLRALRIEHSVPPLILGAEAHRFLLAEQLRGAGVEKATVILEPEGRGTAAAAAIAAHYVADEYGPEAMIFLMSADQAIMDVPRFLDSVRLAAKIAAAGRIVTFGVRPTRPETGFGYLMSGAAVGDTEAREVTAFTEKPDAERARVFLDQGGYFWNAGLFLFRADRLLVELVRLEAKISQGARQALLQARRDGQFLHLDATAYRGCRSDSIDYAVMEKTRNVALVPLDAGWDDVGSWTFLSGQPAADRHGNHVRGDVLLEGAEDNLVLSSNRLVALTGVKDLVVVETADAVLVTRKDRAQDVKRVVQRLKQDGRAEIESHPRVYRPWGYYETVAQGERFQVKRIRVNPGHKLSLQMHHHRAEHWVVVKGTARVTCGDQVFLLTEDKSTYIPLGRTHRLDNPGKVPLELIEVQSGAYLGEDDIVRIEDVYGRAAAAA